MVVQLQQIDKWLLKNPAREQEIRCSIVNLYRITNALLNAENAITNGSLGASVPADQAGAQLINHRDDPGQDTTNDQSNLDDEYLGIIVNRHSKTLTTLRNLVEECLPRGKVEEMTELQQEETVRKFMRHGKIFRALGGISPSVFSFMPDFGHHIVALLQSLGKLVEAWENPKEEEQSERSDKDIIKDILIWRCI